MRLVFSFHQKKLWSIRCFKIKTILTTNWKWKFYQEVFLFWENKVIHIFEIKKYFNKNSYCLTYSYKFAEIRSYERTITKTKTGFAFYFCWCIECGCRNRFVQNTEYVFAPNLYSREWFSWDSLSIKQYFFNKLRDYYQLFSEHLVCFWTRKTFQKEGVCLFHVGFFFINYFEFNCFSNVFPFCIYGCYQFRIFCI